MEIRRFKIHLKSFPGSSYSQSLRVWDTKPADMDYMEWEEEIWKKKMHVSEDGYLVIPGDGFKQSVVAASKDMGTKVPGRGQKRMWSVLNGALMMTENPKTNVKASEVRPIKLACNSTGKKDSSLDVARIFPVVDKWEAKFDVLCPAEVVPMKLLGETISHAGMMIGIGRWKPAKGGMNGRFTLESIKQAKL